jgi:PDDEXK-like domain of unknown function (DUF3799)
MSDETIGPRITDPGVYPDLDLAEYIADPVIGGSLARSDAKMLIAPSCPALYRWEQDNPPDPSEPDVSKPRQLGSVVHSIFLGRGPDIVWVDADTWQTTIAKAERIAARREGKLPMLVKYRTKIDEMVTALLNDERVQELFDRDHGRAEVAAVWRDPKMPSVMRRALFDWLPDPGRPIPDLKTCASASSIPLARAMETYRYHLQAAAGLEALEALGIGGGPFRLVCQETSPPYVINVVEPNAEALQVGRLLNAQAVETYGRCVATDTWPGYNDDGVELLALPPWAEREWETELAAAELTARAAAR